ncbi:N-acetylmuramoyl-L-alanine amidase [Pseudalkalibacillus hwajinpoensis]|uniref:N-acetylmuramoyl-L-alanine amidase n=1 Tax=Guptibacillus hwajinpoensis TaxID=208199 RepID=UPI00325AA7A9
MALEYNGDTGSSWLVTKTNAPTSTATHLHTKEVQANILNVREFPGTENLILAQLPSGSIVKEMEKKNGWSLISYHNGKAGWVDSKYIRGTDKSGGGSAYVTILYQATNLRSGPGTSYNVISQAPIKKRFKIIGKEGKWYRILLRDGSTAYVADWVVSTASNLSILPPLRTGKTVVLDAGHGGHDSGALGISTFEKILTLRTSDAIAEKLKNAGVRVITTRDSDTYISLSERTHLPERYQADAFVSIHFNSTVDPTANGATTYYYDPSDLSLASSIHREIGNETSLQDRGIRVGNYYVLRNNDQPSILHELGFLSNPWEEQLVNRIDYQAKITTEISNGILAYLN